MSQTKIFLLFGFGIRLNGGLGALHYLVFV
uniref:Uncharacterized protein n=1 Tax=Rhizophora mucronata TaxID=61149 RepID=A0A2P2QHC2_RHIMU